jgi:hypothetical protein
LALLVVSLMLAVGSVGCGGGGSARRSEGSQVFRAGHVGSPLPAPPLVIPGPPLGRIGLLTPAVDPTWQMTWVDQRLADASPATRGASAGLMVGLSILQVAPLAIVAWPVAVGVGAAGLIAGSTAVGAVSGGGGLQPGWTSPPDDAAIASATDRLQANRLARAALLEALQQRMGRPVETVPVPGPVGSEGLPPEWLAAARERSLDGLVEMRVEGLGLAAGDDAETFGAFTQIRLRAYDARDGRLRYEQIGAYGPGQSVESLPAPSAYSLIFLAADAGRVYRYEATQAIQRLARQLAASPALPVIGR